MSLLPHTLSGILASVVLCGVTLAQDTATPPPEQRQQAPTPSTQPNRNRVELNLDYHYSQQDPIQEKRQGPTDLGDPLNAFSYRGRFTYEPADEARPSPFFAGVAAQASNISISSDFSSKTQSIVTGNIRNDPTSTTSTKPTSTRSLPTSLASNDGASNRAAKAFSSGNGTPSFLGGGGSGSVSDSDHPLMYGPSLDFPVKNDATEWDPVGILPEGTSLHLYATAMYGNVTLFDTNASMQLYSVGPRLLMPLVGTEDSFFHLNLSLSVGPGYMTSDLGTATGVSTGGGLVTTYSFYKNMTLVLGLEVNAFFSKGFFTWGPTPVIGFNVSW